MVVVVVCVFLLMVSLSLAVKREVNRLSRAHVVAVCGGGD